LVNVIELKIRQPNARTSHQTVAFKAVSHDLNYEGGAKGRHIAKVVTVLVLILAEATNRKILLTLHVL